MKTKIKVCYLFMLLSYCSFVFRVIFPLVDYAVNYKFITEELCVERNNPSNTCHGKCHLTKEIQKQVNPNANEEKLVTVDFIKISHYLKYRNPNDYFLPVNRSLRIFNINLSKNPSLEPLLQPPEYVI
ncbi:MAG: hypothetical protein CR986_04460 [Ignavibacteriae bacterium]|nr:MAG: hypothetical protein CR986_04460 [Ignavibacteriota bacterium]